MCLEEFDAVTAEIELDHFSQDTTEGYTDEQLTRANLIVCEQYPKNPSLGDAFETDFSHYKRLCEEALKKVEI